MAKPVQNAHEQMRRAIALACIAGVMSFTAASFSPGFLVLVGGGALVAWILCPGSGRVAPRRAINAGLLGVVGFGVFQTLRIGISVDAFAYFIGLLLVVKLLDLRRASDWGQTLTLATALVIAGALTSNSLLTGVMLLASTVILLRAVLRYQVCVAQQRAGASGAIDATRQYRRSMRRVQWGISTAVLVAGTAVFLFLPRELGTEAFGRWGSAAIGQTTGFADEVELGQPGLISQSPTPVMDVSVTDREGRNLGKIDAPPIYLRGAVLERYFEGRWIRSRRAERASFRRSEQIPAEMTVRPWRSPDADSWDKQLNITMRNISPAGRTPLFTAWEPLEFAPLGVARMIAYDPGVGTVFVENVRGRMDYRVRVSDPDFRPISVSAGTMRTPVPITEIDPAITAYARQVLEGVSIASSPDERPIADDARAVRSLENYLQSNFTYTLEDQPTPPGRDATEWFLDERRTGHCEYFASALALLSRSVGINARVVTGYVVSDYNEVTRQYVVRESSAHAWVEAEIAPGVWRTFDATPEEEFHQIHIQEPGLARSISNLFETIEFAWVNAVVAYDSESRQAVFGPLSSDFGLLGVAGRFIRRLNAGGTSLVVRAFGFAVVVFSASMLTGLLIVHRRDFLRAVWQTVLDRFRVLLARWRDRSSPPGDKLHRALLRTLESGGHPKPPGTPLRSHLSDEGPQSRWPTQIREAISAACDLLYRDRFAKGGNPQLAEFEAALAGLHTSEKALRRAQKRSG